PTGRAVRRGSRSRKRRDREAVSCRRLWRVSVSLPGSGVGPQDSIDDLERGVRMMPKHRIPYELGDGLCRVYVLSGGGHDEVEVRTRSGDHGSIDAAAAAEPIEDPLEFPDGPVGKVRSEGRSVRSQHVYLD